MITQGKGTFLGGRGPLCKDITIVPGRSLSYKVYSPWYPKRLIRKIREGEYEVWKGENGTLLILLPTSTNATDSEPDVPRTLYLALVLIHWLTCSRTVHIDPHLPTRIFILFPRLKTQVETLGVRCRQKIKTLQGQSQQLQYNGHLCLFVRYLSGHLKQHLQSNGNPNVPP